MGVKLRGQSKLFGKLSRKGIFQVVPEIAEMLGELVDKYDETRLLVTDETKLLNMIHFKASDRMINNSYFADAFAFYTVLCIMQYQLSIDR